MNVDEVLELSEFLKRPTSRVDVIVVLGGDGTLLRVARKVSVPVLGLRFGRVGALSQADPEEIDEALLRLREGRYSLLNVPLLMCRLSTDSVKVTVHALNDVVVISPKRELTDIVVALDGERLGVLRADGIIVATPIGSTAYALSAGGPVVTDRCDVHLLVPICPQLRAFPPLVVPACSRLEVSVYAHGELSVIVDGSERYDLSSPLKLEATRSDKVARLIQFKRNSRVARVLSMLSWALRGSEHGQVRAR